MKGKGIALKRRGRTRGGRGSLPAKIKWLHEFPCDVCGAWPIEVHHPRRLGERASDLRVIPLCTWHHLNPYPRAVHTLGWQGFEEFHGYDIAARCTYWHERWDLSQGTRRAAPIHRNRRAGF